LPGKILDIFLSGAGYPTLSPKRIWKNSADRKGKSLLARLEKPHIGDSLTRRE
jgi:hypothetical protein